MKKKNLDLVKVKDWENNMFSEVKHDADVEWVDVKRVYIALFRTLRLKIMTGFKKNANFKNIPVPFVGTFKFNERRFIQEHITPFKKMRRPSVDRWKEAIRRNNQLLEYNKEKQCKKKK